MKKIICVTAIMLVMPLLVGFGEGPSKKEVKPENTMLQSCPRVINNSDCEVNVDITIYGPSPSNCNDVCFWINIPLGPGNTAAPFPCDQCPPTCNIRLDINMIGNQTYGGAGDYVDWNSQTSWNVTGTTGCNANTVSWNGTDFVISP